jgi:hypothetical protein
LCSLLSFYGQNDNFTKRYFGKDERENLNLKFVSYNVGTKEAYFAIRSDDQLENRFEPLTLPLWKDNAEFASLLASLEATLPLRKQSILTTPEITRFILDKTEGTIGEITTLITKAAVLAVQSGEEAITRKVLSSIDYLSPTERRRVFERELV